MKKTVIIGDVHGHTSWKKIVASESNADVFVFLGDYLDSFSVSSDDQISNLEDILRFKDENSERAVLLLGNHDYHYLIHGSETYSGYSNYTSYKAFPILTNNIDRFSLLYKDGNVLYSHAGVSLKWMEIFMNPKGIFSVNDLCGPLRDDYLRDLRFNNITGYTITGECTSASPIWIRPGSLIDSFYTSDEVSVQVVGHTMTRCGVEHVVEDAADLWLCDCMHTGEYLVREDEIFTIKNFLTEDSI